MQRLSGFMRTYWSRGVPGRPTPRSLNAFMQRMWLLALLFKLLGSSWDVSWHFKWLRDDLAPPHLLNTVGTGIAIGLVLAHSFTGYGVEKASLRLMQWGTGIFVVAGPIDVINHRINGLDLTAWSPSHLLLYTGTAIMIAGVIRNWYRTYPRERGDSRGWTLGMLALWMFLFEDIFFPQLQQEYGILEIGSWFRGAPYAEPSLLTFAAEQLGRPVDDVSLHNFAMPIPPWVYPLWALVICVPLLVFARRMVGFAFTATAVTAGYIAYRLLIWPLLVVGTFPPSVPPVWLIALGLGVDLVFLLRSPIVRTLVGGLGLTALGYGALWLQAIASGSSAHLGSMDIAALRAEFEAGHPLRAVPVQWSTIWLAAIGLLITWGIAEWLANRTVPGQDRPPELTVRFAPEPPRDAAGRLTGPAPVSERADGRPGQHDGNPEGDRQHQ
jgi:hypothetical protein